MIRRRGRRREGWTVLEMAIGISVIAVLAGLVALAYLNYQERLRVSTCHVQQRNLDGMIFSSSLDLNVSVPELFGQMIEKELLSGEVSGGVATAVALEDPGYGNGSWNHYGLSPTPGNMVFCTEHGSPFFGD